jgi:hypothetical protein
MLYYVGTGIICGAFGFYLGQYLIIRKVEKVAVKIKAATELWSRLVDGYRSKLDAISIPPKASAHMKQAEKISIEIQSLTAQAEMPSASALHSKTKNDMKQQIIALNYERLKELQLAVENGYDPIISYAGINKKLSEIVVEQLRESDKVSGKSVAVSTKPKAEVKPKSHLSIVK